MFIIVIILILIIIVLTSYIILIKRDLKRIVNEIKDICESDSNMNVNSEIGLVELNSLIKELNILLKEKKELKFEYNKKTDMLNKMMLNISHDLKTPLTSSLGYIDIILDSKKNRDDYHKELKIVEERLKHLDYLINSFFEFSKISLGSTNIDLEDENIIAILEESIVHYYDDFKRSKRDIIFNKNKTKCNITTNKDILMRIFDNLIANAMKHSDSDLVIDLEVSNKLVIKFSNDCIQKELDIDQIFDEFYTLDISRTKGNTGLGLAIVKNFTSLLNGRISARKDKNKLEICLEFDL